MRRQAPLRGDVQHSLRPPVEQIGLFLKVTPHQPMTFEGATPPAAGIGTGLDTHGKELAAAAVTDRAVASPSDQSGALDGLTQAPWDEVEE